MRSRRAVGSNARARELGVEFDALRAGQFGATWFGDNFHDIDWSLEGYDANNTIKILEKNIRSGLDAMTGAGRAKPDAFDAALLAAIRAMERFEK